MPKLSESLSTLRGNFTPFNSLGMWEWKGGHLNKTDLKKTENLISKYEKSVTISLKLSYIWNQSMNIQYIIICNHLHALNWWIYFRRLHRLFRKVHIPIHSTTENYRRYLLISNKITEGIKLGPEEQIYITECNKKRNKNIWSPFRII